MPNSVHANTALLTVNDIAKIHQRMTWILLKCTLHINNPASSTSLYCVVEASLPVCFCTSFTASSVANAALGQIMLSQVHLVAITTTSDLITHISTDSYPLKL